MFNGIRRCSLILTWVRLHGASFKNLYRNSHDNIFQHVIMFVFFAWLEKMRKNCIFIVLQILIEPRHSFTDFSKKSIRYCFCMEVGFGAGSELSLCFEVWGFRKWHLYTYIYIIIGFVFSSHLLHQWLWFSFQKKDKSLIFFLECKPKSLIQ